MRNLCGYVPLCYHQLGEQGMRLCCGLCYNREPGRGRGAWRGRGEGGEGGGAAEGGGGRGESMGNSVPSVPKELEIVPPHPAQTA